MVVYPVRKCLGARRDSKQSRANMRLSLPDQRQSLKSIFASLPLRVMVKHHQLIGLSLLCRSHSLEGFDIQTERDVDRRLTKILSNLGQPPRGDNLLQRGLPSCVYPLLRPIPGFQVLNKVKTTALRS